MVLRESNKNLVYSIHSETYVDEGMEKHYRQVNMTMGDILSYSREDIVNYLNRFIKERAEELKKFEEEGEMYAVQVMDLSSAHTTVWYIAYEEINPKTHCATHVRENYTVRSSTLYAKGELK